VTVRGDVGWAVIVGRVPTVSVTVLLMTAPAVLETLQRNWSPLISRAATTLKEAVVVPV